MRDMRRDIITAAIGILVFTLLCGIAYPLVVTGISQGLFPGNANGQQVKVNGVLVGSKIIGQSFEEQAVKDGKPEVDKTGGPVLYPDPRYFQTRPSGTGEPYEDGGTPDNDAATAFANLGPNDLITAQDLKANLDAYLALEKPYDPTLSAAQVPVDAVDVSASGVDPDISQANAWIQAHRIAAVRHLTLATVDHLIAQYTAGRGLGFSGEPSVDVLELNLALNRLTGTGAASAGASASASAGGRA
jgi:K+-transporting ATPase ATPase C chain